MPNTPDLFPNDLAETDPPDSEVVYERLDEPVFVRAPARKQRQKRSNGAQRQARYRQRQSDNAISQVNVLAHADYHATIRDLARRSVEGQLLAEALADIAPNAPVWPPEPQSAPESTTAPAVLHSPGWRAAIARWLLGISRYQR